MTEQEIQILARSILSVDERKVMYRGNFTIKQAALYMGMGEPRIKAMIFNKEIRINYVGSGTRISRAECDRVLMANSGFKV